MLKSPNEYNTPSINSWITQDSKRRVWRGALVFHSDLHHFSISWLKTQCEMAWCKLCIYYSYNKCTFPRWLRPSKGVWKNVTKWKTSHHDIFYKLIGHFAQFLKYIEKRNNYYMIHINWIKSHLYIPAILLKLLKPISINRPFSSKC